MARTFNGNAANYLHATGLLYNLPTNCTIVWRAKTASDTVQNVMGRRNATASGDFSIRRDADFNSVILALFGDGDKFRDASFDKWPADGNYHSFIITKAGTALTLYVDVPTAVATATGTYSAAATGDLFVGALNDLSGGGAVQAFNGALQDVAIFPSVLGSTDRAAYLGGAAPSALSAAGTDHYWPLNNAEAEGETDDFGSADLAEVGTVGYESAGGPVLTGNPTTDDSVASGQLGTAAPGSLSGTVVADDAAPSGTLASQPGTITSSRLAFNNDEPHLNAPFEAFISARVTGVLIVRKTGLTSSNTNDGTTHPRCVATDLLLVPGTPVRVTWRNTANGTEGTELLTVA